MILTCPECATRYQTDAALFTPEGRKVRCAKCGHVWLQGAPAPEPEAELVRADEAEALSAGPASPQRAAYAPASVPTADEPVVAPTRWLERVSLAVGWLALAVILLTIGWSGIRYRQDVAELWPQSSSLYAAIGIPVNALGIEFRNRNARFETENGEDVLVITGDVTNITSRELTVPPIRVSLTDGDERELYHWSFSPGVATLAPGQWASFHTRLSDPPPAARHIELRFAEPDN